jgi:asparagine synthase (glutamine-hydrolysing)
MCGLAGIVQYRSEAPVEEQVLLRLRDAQIHRGPDDQGSWISADGRVGLGHRRLAIIDLSEAGRQPMATADGKLQITFNGEIYNYRDLRSELQAAGAEFRTATDTEVILHGYRHWGVGVLDRLRGMFAFGLWDAGKSALLLARDPLGIKPLYTIDDGKRVLFASEVQALRAVADDGGLDVEALARFLVWGSIPPPRTLHAGIRALPPGSYSWVRCAGEGASGPARFEAPTSFFSLADAFRNEPTIGADEGAAWLHEALRDTARAHLEADVPVGAFLSGGVDSSALVGLLTEQSAEIRTVTLAFDVASLDESALAREAAELYGADHREIPIGVDEIRDLMPEAIRALDQPSVNGVNTYFVAKAAVSAGLKVAVSGVGGDELFGGYSSFARVPRIRRLHGRIGWLPGAVLGAAASAVESLPAGRVTSRVAKGLRFAGDDAGAYFAERSIFAPAEVRRLLAPEFGDAVDGAVDELRASVDVASLPEDERVSALEFRQYLGCQLMRDTDAVSMRHSLEVRTPLVDRELLERACRVQPLVRRAGPAKRHLREAPRCPVPDSLWNRPKQGFTLPFDHWLKTGGIELRMPEHDSLRPEALKAVEDGFRGGRLHFSTLLPPPPPPLIHPPSHPSTK